MVLGSKNLEYWVRGPLGGPGRLLFVSRPEPRGDAEGRNLGMASANIAQQTDIRILGFFEWGSVQWPYIRFDKS